MSRLDQEVSGQTPIVHIRGLNKDFGSVRALHEIDLDVSEGEFLTLLGPSGCGKTTLIRIIAGFEFQSAGAIEISGQSIAGLPPHRRPIGMVFQNLALFPHMTVAQNIAYGLKVRGLDSSSVRAKVDAMLDMIGLQGLGDRFIGQISGGQKQRVALARAVVTEPKVLLLDEPLGALDMKIRRQMQSELKQVQERLGTTFIFVTHDQEEALTMSDRIAVFNTGRIEQIGTPSDIYERPKTAFVAQFVGDSNFIEGEIVKDASGSVFRSEYGIAFPVTNGGTGRAAASIRPQHVEMDAPGRSVDGNEAIRLSAKVVRRVYAGQTVRVWLEADGKPLIADVPANHGAIPENGQTVNVGWRRESAVIVPL